MTNRRHRKLKISLFPVIAILYIAWSQLEIYSIRESLKMSETRIYNIADNLELWKKISIEHAGQFDIRSLRNDRRNIRINRITRKEALLLQNKEDQLYIIFYDEPDKKRKKELDRYFSELVLRNYLYVITDKNKKIKEMFWDKP
ncbi:MAG: hypothetical protein V3U75_09125 [Methylococcaceae bacterium]